MGKVGQIQFWRGCGLFWLSYKKKKKKKEEKKWGGGGVVGGVGWGKGGGPMRCQDLIM